MEHTKKLAVLLALSVAAFGSTARAATVYGETISGSGDTSYSSIKTVDGNGYTYTFNEGDTLQINTADATDGKIYGVLITRDNPSSIIIENLSGINVQYELTDAGNEPVKAYGIYLTENGGKDKEVPIFNFKGGGAIQVKAAADAGSASATGVEVQGCTGRVELGTGEISAVADASAESSSADAYGIRLHDSPGAADQNTTRLTKSGGTIQAQAKGPDRMEAYGVSVSESNTIELQDVRIFASAVGDGNNGGGVYGIFTSSGTVSMTRGEITVKAENVGTTFNNVYAVDNQGGTVRLGQDADGQATDQKLVIHGDVWNETDASTTGISLRTAESALNGSVRKDNGTVNLELANGAVWNNGEGFHQDIASSVTTLTMDGGVVHQLSAKDMTIQNYSGMGDFLFKADDTAQDGVLSFGDTGTVTIGSAAAGSAANLSVCNTAVDTLDAAKAEESLNAIAYRMMYEKSAENTHVTGKVTLAEGLITPEASGDLNFYNTTDERNTHGYVTNVTRGSGETATMSAMKHIATVSVLAWRQEDSTFSQRLGDLRRSVGGQGLWARMSRGEFKYDGEYKNQYDFYQLGYDRASGPWHYGAAFSYNDGETSYRAGYGENSSASLSLYGTWLGDKGHYADIVLKGGKLSNEYTITTAAGRTHGDYDLWGVSLSGEYGREIALADGWFVTPQAQMTLLHIGSEDYTTSNGIRVSQESLDSAVGRVGLEAGKRFGAGRVYGKFSLLHDFAGSADTWLRYEGLENSYREDIGDTWCEAGFGVNLRLSDSTYFYADVARTFGGDIETPWQWNAGVRWGF